MMAPAWSQTSHSTDNQHSGQPQRRGPGRPPRVPVQIRSQPVPIAPRLEAHHSDNARLEGQGDQHHLQTTRSTAPITLASTFSVPGSTGYDHHEIPAPISLICVGTARPHHLAGPISFHDHSPPEYKTDISFMHGDKSQTVINAALISRRWPDRCFIPARWLPLLGQEAVPLVEPRAIETPQGTIVAYRQVPMWFSLPHQQYSGIVQAIVLDDIEVGVAAIFGGSWVDLVFNGGDWRLGGASTMAFFHSCGP